jgi:hypothetical protein
MSNSNRDEVKKAWRDVFLSEPPPEEQWDRWEQLYPLPIIKEGLVQLAIKFQKLGGKMDANYMYRFASSVMSVRGKQQRDALAKLRNLPITASVQAEEVNGNK